MLKYYSDYNNKFSISFFFRKKRAKFMSGLLKTKSGNKILDIGGFGNSLEILDKNLIENNDITVLNIENVEITNKNIKFILGDSTDSHLFPPNSFDLVHCNSVIEHVGNFEQRKKLSLNIQKWGKKYFVQTPNYYFPVEPHFLFPFFQFLPISIRAFILTKMNLASYKKEIKLENALKIVSSVNLLKKSDLLVLFPDAKIIREKFLFLTKSFLIHNFE